MVWDPEDMGSLLYHILCKPLTTKLPVQPWANSVSLSEPCFPSLNKNGNAYLTGFQGLNMLCNLSSGRPMSILIIAICPGFWVQSQISPEAFVTFSLSLTSNTQCSAKKRRAGHRVQIPSIETVVPLWMPPAMTLHPAEGALFPGLLNNEQPDLIWAADLQIPEQV